MTSPWRPIETAPKDGTWVLIAGGTIRTLGVTVDHEYTGVGIAAYNGRRECWDRDDGRHRHDPTHWMPIPDPPEVEAGEGAAEGPGYEPDSEDGRCEDCDKVGPTFVGYAPHPEAEEDPYPIIEVYVCRSCVTKYAARYEDLEPGEGS